MENGKIVCIDGHSGVGKGTISKLLVKELGYSYLDSGALYRALAYIALDKRLDLGNPVQLGNLAKKLPVLTTVNAIFYTNKCITTGIKLRKIDISVAIRNEKIAKTASKIAGYKEVRFGLLKMQRNYATKNGLVADGRDMGTVVFPNAKYKIFLNAASEERAKRRLLQYYKDDKAKCQKLSEASFKQLRQNNAYLEILHNIEARDQQDSQRAEAPLKPAKNALVIDTSNLTIEQVYRQIIGYIVSKK